VLEEVFEIALNLESESVLFLSMVLLSNLYWGQTVIAENQPFRLNDFCETQGLEVLEETSHRSVPREL
jgi:hypothetical protein